MTARLRLPRVPEKTVQAQVVMLLRAVGCYVYVFGTTRPRGDTHGTCQTPGIPDLWWMHPRIGHAGWFEVKAANGRLRPAQAAFQQVLLEAIAAQGVLGLQPKLHHTVGGVHEAQALLVTVGLAEVNHIRGFTLKAHA